MVINLKTAQTLGLEIPHRLLVGRRGDRIEVLFAAAHESVHGTSANFGHVSYCAAIR
jgi:hypothetical protein